LVLHVAAMAGAWISFEERHSRKSAWELSLKLAIEGYKVMRTAPIKTCMRLGSNRVTRLDRTTYRGPPPL
jgi:hypothetical protein